MTLEDIFIKEVKDDNNLTKEQKKEKIKALKKYKKERLHNPVRKEWLVYMKKAKKDLVKCIKKFQPWDYHYILEPLMQMLEMFYNTYIHKELLYQDTDIATSDYDKIISSLEKCHNIIAALNNDDLDFLEEHDLLIELFDTIKKNILFWWD